jgi:hypothetical protein
MSSTLTGDPTAFGQELLSSQPNAAHTPGEKATDGLGRKFRYVRAGGVALVPGNMIQGPAPVALHQNLVVPAQTGVVDAFGNVGGAAGSKLVKVTLGAALTVANQYAGGWLLVDTAGTGSKIGYMYPISGHPAAGSAQPLTLTLSMPIQEAIVAGQNTVSLVQSPYVGVIQTPITTLTGPAVGSAVFPINPAEYGWVQSGGPAAVLVAGTPGAGLAVVVPGTAAGAVVVDGAAAATPPIGYMMVAGIDGKACPVFLTID